jgi:hypothetical protein
MEAPAEAGALLSPQATHALHISLQATLYAAQMFVEFLQQQQDLTDGLLGRQLTPFPGLNHAV